MISTSTDANRNLVAALSYLMFFITGIIILLVEKDDKFIRFHAMQSITALGGLFVAGIILGLVLSPLGIVATIVNFLIWIVSIYVWISSMIRAYQGKIFKWPIAGDFSEKQVK